MRGSIVFRAKHTHLGIHSFPTNTFSLDFGLGVSHRLTVPRGPGIGRYYMGQISPALFCHMSVNVTCGNGTLFLACVKSLACAENTLAHFSADNTFLFGNHQYYPAFFSFALDACSNWGEEKEKKGPHVFTGASGRVRLLFQVSFGLRYFSGGLRARQKGYLPLCKFLSWEETLRCIYTWETS